MLFVFHIEKPPLQSISAVKIILSPAQRLQVALVTWCNLATATMRVHFAGKE
jgi:hypothetical protein